MYIVHLHLHGLFRSRDLELGRDSDTGGQTEYVLNLVTELSQHSGVDRVEVITRLINDPSVSPDYARPLEAINNKASITRLPFGPLTYLKKEDLWSHLYQLTDALTLRFTQSKRPDFIHAHYADAGHVAACLSERLGIPMIFTGHSYGQDKLHSLLRQGFSESEIDAEFNIWRRIAAEEASLKRAKLVVTSTTNEASSQLFRYGSTPNSVLVNSPGFGSCFHSASDDTEDQAISRLVEPFLRDTTKPPVLAISRLDKRKNVPMLVEAFGRSGLSDRANLVLVLGVRDDVRDLSKGAHKEWVKLMEAIDLYDLHGSVAFPKSHQRSSVPAIYRWAAQRQGVFVNPALVEPFGLTCIEAMASGLPVLATNNGGPQDILKGGELGVLFDAQDRYSIQSALTRGLTDQREWQQWQNLGLQSAFDNYSWRSHADRYISQLKNQ